jgi:basic amino acid/polyamine antiporter, APA family
LAAFFTPERNSFPNDVSGTTENYGLALILVMFTFGGWSDLAFISAEVRDSRRNIPRILISALGIVTLLYLFTNAAFLWALGHAEMAASETVAIDAVRKLLPLSAQAWVSALIALSALGAINAMLFTGARVNQVLKFKFKMIGSVQCESENTGNVIMPMLFLGASSAFIIAWMGSFERTVIYATPVVWLFYLLSTLGLFRLRQKEPRLNRSFSVPCYPWLPICFCGACLYICYAAILYDPTGSLIALAVLMLGIPCYRHFVIGQPS